MNIHDIESDTKFQQLFKEFISNKNKFHDLLNYIENSSYFKKVNDEYREKIPDTVYRGVYFWNDDYDEEEWITIKKEISSREKEKTNTKGISYSSCSYSKTVAENFSKVLGDVGYLITFKINTSDVIFVPLAFIAFLDDPDVISTIKYEKEVIINPNTSRILSVKRVKR